MRGAGALAAIRPGRLVPLALALALAACGLGAAGRSGVTAFVTPPAAGQAIRVTVDDGTGPRALAPHVGPWEAGSYDLALVPGRAATVRAELWQAGAVLARVSRRIEPQADIGYEIHASTGADDPTALCMGCGEAASAPVDRASPDGERLWLYTAFNGLSAPIQF